MKRYFAFYGDVFYPTQGMDDFIGDFDTEEEAKAAIDYTRINEGGCMDWGQIYDTDKREIIYSDQN